jgi:hypothetical protein
MGAVDYLALAVRPKRVRHGVNIDYIIAAHPLGARTPASCGIFYQNGLVGREEAVEELLLGERVCVSASNW